MPSITAPLTLCSARSLLFPLLVRSVLCSGTQCSSPAIRGRERPRRSCQHTHDGFESVGGVRVLGRVCPLACCSGYGWAMDGWFGGRNGWVVWRAKGGVGCRWVFGGRKGAGEGGEEGGGFWFGEGKRGGEGGGSVPPLFQNPKTEPQPGRCRRSASQTLLLWVCLESLERPTLLLWVWTSAGALPLLLPLCRHVAALVQSSTLSRVGVSSRRPHPAEFETGILSHLRLKIRG